jgi:hypothetical protein
MGPPPNPPANWLDPSLVSLFDSLVCEIQPRVVLSSSWRCYLPLEQISEALTSRGLSVNVADATPDLKTKSGPMLDRWVEIETWLKEHPEVTRWAVLDDLPLVTRPTKEITRFVRTNSKVGLTEENCHRVRDILTRFG